MPTGGVLSKDYSLFVTDKTRSESNLAWTKE